MSDFEVLPLGLNPYKTDPGAWGASLVNNAEVLLGALDLAGAGSVMEVGAYAGDLTRLLLLWARESGAQIVAIDPSPQPELEELEREHQELTLIRETSLISLARDEPLPDAVILDGDHNHYTVEAELRLIDERTRALQNRFPLVLLHDVLWPHGRRDDYFDPEQVPREHRQPVVPEGTLYPGIEGVHTGGMPYHWPAAREGGARNGVLTAVEDFTRSRDDLQLMVIPAFFGLGLLFEREADYAQNLVARFGPWDRHPLLARLERNRVLHLASSQVQLQLASAAQERAAEMEKLLRHMLNSRAFTLAELWARVRERGEPPFSRRRIRRLLDERATAPGAGS